MRKDEIEKLVEQYYDPLVCREKSYAVRLSFVRFLVESFHSDEISANYLASTLDGLKKVGFF